MLEKIDSAIRAFARRYATGDQIDDFSQIGRMAAWVELEKTPDAHAGRLVLTAKHAMLNRIKHGTAKKRRPEGGLRSLDAPLGDGTATLHTFLGVEDDEPLRKSSVVEVLKQRYGNFHISGIRSETQPKRIVRNIIRTTIEDVVGIEKEEIPKTVDYKFFVDHGLQSLLWAFYRNSPFAAVNDTYNEFLPWEFKRVKNGYWKGKRGYNRAREAVAWLLRKHDVRSAEDCELTGKDFVDAGLSGMLQHVFNDSPLLAFQSYFPDMKMWQSAGTPRGFFGSDANRITATVWYLQQRGLPSIIELDDVEVYEAGIRTITSKDDMCSYGLRGLLAKYGNSTYGLFSSLFPSKIHPWTIFGAKKIWSENPHEIAASAVRWLFEKYLEVDGKDIPAIATCNLFWNVGYSGILTNRRLGFNSSPYRALDNAYPGVFSASDFDKQRETIRLDVEVVRRVRDKVAT